jgi:hypothetical protein
MYVLLALVAVVQQAVTRPASPASDTVVLRVLSIDDFHGALESRAGPCAEGEESP